MCIVPSSNQPPRLAILGLGKMGSILLQAFCGQKVAKPEDIVATVGHAERLDGLAAKFGVRVTTDNRAAVKNADVILLCIKPQVLGEVVEEIRPELREGQLIISIAASVPTSYIEQRIPAGIPVVRAMPNTPSRVGAGMTAFCPGKFGEAERSGDRAPFVRHRRRNHPGGRKAHGRRDRTVG